MGKLPIAKSFKVASSKITEVIIKVKSGKIVTHSIGIYYKKLVHTIFNEANAIDSTTKINFT